MSLFLDWAIQPLGLITLFILAGMLCLSVRRSPNWLAKLFLVLGLSLFWIFSSPGFANSLVLKIENRRLNPADCDPAGHSASITPVVVLGGGMNVYSPATSPYELLGRDSLARVFRASALANDNEGNARQFYLSGGGPSGRTLAELMAQVMVDQGISPDKLVLEKNSRSTRENAEAINGLLPVATNPAIILVSSAIHLPRAAATFEKIGYEVCHVSADTLYAPAVFPVSLMPYISGLVKSTYALRELFATSVYSLRGYT